MNVIFGDVPPQRQRLAEALRRLRMRAGLSGPELARRIGTNQSRVSRLELGKADPRVPEVEKWAEACGASADDIASLVREAETQASEVLSWRRAERHGLARVQQDIRSLEASSGVIRTWQPITIPGLLQGPEYARYVLESTHPDKTDIAEAVAARMERQSILFDGSRRIELLTTEQALRWPFGTRDEHVAQINRILTVTKLPHVFIGILPATHPRPIWHGWNLYEERGDRAPLVIVEVLHAAITVEGEDVDVYRSAFERLRQGAVSGEAAVALLHEITKELGL